MSMSDSIGRLYNSVVALQNADPSASRTARLFRAGRSKVAKKLAEEAAEVVIDAMLGNREAVIRESADLLYNLVVLWAESDIRPEDVWAEMARREKMLGLAEKLPKESGKDLSKATGSKSSPKETAEGTGRRKVVALETHGIPKRRRSGY